MRRTSDVVKDRRCDATFAYQQIMNDVFREVLDYTSRCHIVLQITSYLVNSYLRNLCLLLSTFYIRRKVLRRIQAISGIYGLVAPCEKTCVLHPVVGRFHTGDTLRVVQPAEVVEQTPWILEGNKSCGLKIKFDLPRDKSLGTLTVRVCWSTTVFNI